MSNPRIEAIVREFKQNGLKLLLEHPYNVRDLLAIAEADVLDRIDFEHMTVMPTTFVQRDYRHVEADVVLRAPLRQRGRRGGRRQITIYILIEHQSEPDALMVFRVLEYVVQIFKSQARAWAKRHRTLTGLRLQPVLPIVFYTGTRRWETLGRLVDLVELGEEFADVTPSLAPLFVNLSVLPPDWLESAGGFFGRLLRLVQQRYARPEEFQELLRHVVEQLEAIPATQRLRWLELLSYIHALVYHERDLAEHEGLQEQIEDSVQTGQHRQEVSAMGKTIAEGLMDRGRKEGRKEEAVRSRRQTLLRLLRQRFGELPRETVAAVEATTSVKQLDTFLDRVLTAAALGDVGIG